MLHLALLTQHSDNKYLHTFSLIMSLLIIKRVPCSGLNIDYSRFTEPEMKRMYRGFKTECPQVCFSRYNYLVVDRIFVLLYLLYIVLRAWSLRRLSTTFSTSFSHSEVFFKFSNIINSKQVTSLALLLTD